jgi:hypothetical protein
MDRATLLLLRASQESAQSDQQDADPHQKDDHGEEKHEVQPMPDLRYFQETYHGGSRSEIVRPSSDG